MCRYATAYKPHYACFRCRKSFKRRLLEDVNPGGEARPSRCPQCGELMANMGLDFAPPRSSQVRAWQVLEGLWTLGETFHSCGCSGPGYRPRTKLAYLEHLRWMEALYTSRLNDYVARRRPRSEPSPIPVKKATRQQVFDARVEESIEEAIVHWRARLIAIRVAMAAQEAG